MPSYNENALTKGPHAAVQSLLGVVHLCHLCRSFSQLVDRVPGGSSQAVPGPKERCGAWSDQCSPRLWEEFQPPPLCKPMDLPFIGTWVTVNEIISIRWLACHRHAILLCSLLHTLEFAESSACPCCADPSRSCVQCQMAGFVLSGQQESSWICCYYLLFQVV